MNVRELKAALENIDDETLVVISADSEGNAYQAVYSLDVDVVFKDACIGYAALTPELEAAGYTECDVIEDGVSCIVLWS